MRNAFALVICCAEIELRFGVFLFGGSAKPFHCLHIILRNSSTLAIHYAEIELRLGVFLFNSGPIPFHRFCKILWNIYALVIHRAEIELCFGISLFGLFAEEPHLFGFAPSPSAHIQESALGGGLDCVGFFPNYRSSARTSNSEGENGQNDSKIAPEFICRGLEDLNHWAELYHFSPKN